MKNRYFTKFCGITNIKDALSAQNLACDALGFVFVKSSKRFIDVKTSQRIISHLSPTILKVALFANNSKDEISKTINQCAFHVLQFHGSESADFCRQWHLPYWKAIPMADKIDVLEYAAEYPDAQGYIIDNFGVKQSGGSGKKIDWHELPRELDNKWILAGGLTPENILQAKTITGLRCFDVSSGIEISAGIKCQTKMKNFIENLND